MTYKEKKEYLEGYLSSKRRIRGLQCELEEWQTIATNITQKISPVIVRSNDNTSKVERCAIRCHDIQEQIYKELKKAEETRTQVENTINSISDLRRRDIFTMRYVNGLSVQKIAILLDKDTNNVHKMIRTGIRSLDL